MKNWEMVIDKFLEQYKNEDYFLEGLQVRLEDILKELENYKCI